MWFSLICFLRRTERYYEIDSIFFPLSTLATAGKAACNHCSSFWARFQSSFPIRFKISKVNLNFLFLVLKSNLTEFSAWTNWCTPLDCVQQCLQICIFEYCESREVVAASREWEPFFLKLSRILPVTRSKQTCQFPYRQVWRRSATIRLVLTSLVRLSIMTVH